MRQCITYISKGEIVNKPVVAKAFKGLEDGAYTVTIAGSKKRSLPQNAYLHGIMIPLVFEGLRAVGWNEIRDHEDAKLMIKTLFLKRKVTNELTGETMEFIKPTHELTTEEMNVFINEVQMWAAEYLGIEIPDPNTQAKLFA